MKPPVVDVDINLLCNLLAWSVFAMQRVTDAEIVNEVLGDCEKHLHRFSAQNLRTLLGECDSGDASPRALPVRWAQFRILIAAEIVRADASAAPQKPTPPRSLRLLRLVPDR